MPLAFCPYLNTTSTAYVETKIAREHIICDICGGRKKISVRQCNEFAHMQTWQSWQRFVRRCAVKRNIEKKKLKLNNNR